jgi:hypothetical protein
MKTVKALMVLLIALVGVAQSAELPRGVVQSGNVSYFLVRYSTNLPGVPAAVQATHGLQIWIHTSDPATVAFRVTARATVAGVPVTSSKIFEVRKDSFIPEIVLKTPTADFQFAEITVEELKPDPPITR